MNTQAKIFTIIVIALIIGVIIGYFLGLHSGHKKAYNQGLEQGRQEVKEKYQSKIEELFPTPPEPEKIFLVSGKIKEIKDKNLTLERTIPPINPFEEPKTEIKKVKITPGTEIVKRVEKSPEELEIEEKAFRKAIEENPKIPISPPDIFKETTISLSSLKVGDVITIEAEENIKDKTEFSAKKISLLRKELPE